MVYCICEILGIGEDEAVQHGAFQSLGHMIIMCFLVLMGYLVGKAEWDFHQRGGLKAVDADNEKAPFVVESGGEDDEYKASH